jgi:hypothetical protein
LISRESGLEAEQAGQQRADYGVRLLERLSVDLSHRFGRGFSATNLRHFRVFYLGWQIQQMPSAELSPVQILQITSEQFPLP